MRQKLLDDYVNEVATNLNRLPTHERVLEVEEIRQHLDKLIDTHLELGISEEEATRSAITQFGKARQVGSGLTNAYLRKLNPLRDSLMWALMVAFIAQKVVGGLNGFATTAAAHWINGNMQLYHANSLLIGLLFMLLHLGTGLVVSLITFRFAPQKAVPATVAALTLPFFLFAFNIMANGGEFVSLDWLTVKVMLPEANSRVVVLTVFPEMVALAAGLVYCLRHAPRKLVVAK